VAHRTKEERMKSRVRRAARSVRDRGASAVEYGLMVAAIAGMIVGVVFGFGNLLDQTFSKTSNCMAAHSTGSPFPGCPAGP
jgi:pilus assembly protein Flp/PilA